MINKNHHFFLLELSPWPLVISFLSFNLFFSILLLLKFQEPYPFMWELFFSFLASFLWWTFYSSEMNLEGKSSMDLESGVKIGMILFISSEVFFFFSFFWSYFHYFLSPTLELGLSWPPVGLVFFDFLNVPLINTLVLLSSGVTVTISHFYLNLGKKHPSDFWLFLTILLGLFFTALQILEYSTSFFSLSDGSFGTSFFLLTGFHGIHVIIGTIFLFYCIIRSFSLMSSKLNFLSFELASWYWHFVDVVWIFLYFFLYYLTN